MNDIQSDFFNELMNYELTQIPSETRFWMIRTKQGYFYEEFIKNQYVAVAWNTIDKSTNFSPASKDAVCDLIRTSYKEIKRPATVFNKCDRFINHINLNDILIIPSASSRYITFAYAGEYYEDNTKTYDEEIDIISKIESGTIDTVVQPSCPYKKRRKITIIRTVKSSEINLALLKSISSYHGVCSLDKEAYYILDHLFNSYSYNHKTHLVFHVGTDNPIPAKDFSGFLYYVTKLLSCAYKNEEAISTQASVHSVGDFIFQIPDLIAVPSKDYLFFIALAVILGGGKFGKNELPGIAKTIKSFINIPHEMKMNEQKLTEKKLKNLDMAIEIKKKLDASGISPDELQVISDTLITSSTKMKIEPIKHNNVIPDSSDLQNTETDDESEEQ
ncbi:MAG: hypothetical protein PUB28_12765 [Roseburia sp.]|nr:hypothetical protein [Roseburia sp.]